MLGRPLFNQFALIHENDPVGNLAGEAHFMGNHNHGHPFAGKLFHNVQNLAYHRGIEGTGRFVEEHDLRVHVERPGDGDALLLGAGEP